jgi:hypothetical protein
MSSVHSSQAQALRMVQLQDIEYRVTNVKAYSRTEFSVLIVLGEMLVKVVKEKEVRSCVLFVSFLLHYYRM